jgi:hypothetical protein
MERVETASTCRLTSDLVELSGIKRTYGKNAQSTAQSSHLPYKAAEKH